MLLNFVCKQFAVAVIGGLNNFHIDDFIVRNLLAAVFLFLNLQLRFVLGCAVHVSRETLDFLVFTGIDMHRNENIGHNFISHLGAFFERKKYVGGAGINDLNARNERINIMTEFERDFQRQVLFLGHFSECARVFAAVSSVYQNFRNAVCRVLLRLTFKTINHCQQYTYNNCSHCLKKMFGMILICKVTQIIVNNAKIIPTMSAYLPKNAYFCGVFQDNEVKHKTF